MQRYCLVHRCPVCQKVWSTQGSEIEPQYRDAHRIRLVCLWNLLHGVEYRKGTRAFAAPSFSSRLEGTGTRTNTAQAELRRRAQGGHGWFSAAPGDASNSKKVTEGEPLSTWPWNQRFAFGSMGGE